MARLLLIYHRNLASMVVCVCKAENFLFYFGWFLTSLCDRKGKEWKLRKNKNMMQAME